MSYTITRRVLIQKGPNGLGFSVKGGGDVGIPLVVSRVEAGGGAVGLLKVGMEISAVNGISLEGLPHYAAVEVLRRTRSPVILFVKNAPLKTEAHLESYRSSGTLRSSSDRSFQSPNFTNGDRGSFLRDSSHHIISPEDTYDMEYKLYYGPDTPDLNRTGQTTDECGPQNEDLYDLRTVKKYVKEILHLPKEIFAKKLAWKFPPVALGKFHKWLLTKLAKFDCEAPKNTANYIFDAFSQSLYLSRSIYDLVHLIRTLIAMKRTNDQSSTALQPVPQTTRYSATLPSSICGSAEFNNPEIMAAFLSELAEIRTQLAKAKEKEIANGSLSSYSMRDTDVQNQISKQDAEIKALRDQLGVYEARIAALTNTTLPSKDGDLSSFFREGFKKIKMKTLRRKQSLPSAEHEKSSTIRAVKSEYKPSEEELEAMNVPEHQPATSTPIPPKQKRAIFSPGSLNSEIHNEIMIEVGGEEVRAHAVQASSSSGELKQDSGCLSVDNGGRERLYSSDDDYVQMHATLSPDGTLQRINCDPLCPAADGSVIRRVSGDHKRSSVDSSQSKSSVESIKLKHKQTIMIENSPHDDSSDYINMTSMDSDTETDYVSCDRVVSTDSSQYHVVVSTGCEENIEQNTVEQSDTMSTSTVKADVNVAEERQINATQVREINNDVDSILGDVKMLYMMEEALKKPPTLPPNTPYIFNVSNGSLQNGMSSSGTYPGGMVKAHEVPVYAKVERVFSPPAPRIRPFSHGETSNCSFTSQEELLRHEVCSTRDAQEPPAHCVMRKTSLTSNGSSVELKSDYSSDRPNSYNTSHTLSTEPSHGDRLSRVSSDINHEDYHERRLSVLSDGKPVYDNVFSPDNPAIQEDPLTPQLHHKTHNSSSQSSSRSDSLPRSANVSLVEEDCFNQEVGRDFFDSRDGRGREKPSKNFPFKKMLSFGKGKNKKKTPPKSQTDQQNEEAVAPDKPERAITRSQHTSSASHDASFHSASSNSGSMRARSNSGSVISPRVSSNGGSVISPRASSNSGLVISPRESGISSLSRDSYISRGSSGHSQDTSECSRSRGSSGNSQDRGSSGNSQDRVSMRSSAHCSQDHYLLDISAHITSPHAARRHSPIIETTVSNLTESTGARLDFQTFDQRPADIYTSGTENGSDRPLVATKPQGFYGDLNINFDAIPVRNEPIMDMANETIIDLDGDIIKDPDELKVLRENTSFSFNSNSENNYFLLNTSNNANFEKSDKSLITDCNLTTKVESELKIDSECSKMISEITRSSSPGPFLRVKGAEARTNTPSPSFSEIDMLLGNISADLDNFTI